MTPEEIAEAARFAAVQALREYDYSGLSERVRRATLDAASQLKAELPPPGAPKLGGFAAASATSRAAALDNYPRSGSQRHTCLLEVARSPGVTSEQIADRHGIHLPSVKPRLTQLKQMGWIAVCGQTPGATGSDIDRYELTPEGRAQIANAEPDFA